MAHFSAYCYLLLFVLGLLHGLGAISIMEGRIIRPTSTSQIPTMVLLFRHVHEFPYAVLLGAGDLALHLPRRQRIRHELFRSLPIHVPNDRGNPANLVGTYKG